MSTSAQFGTVPISNHFWWYCYIVIFNTKKVSKSALISKKKKKMFIIVKVMNKNPSSACSQIHCNFVWLNDFFSFLYKNSLLLFSSTLWSLEIRCRDTLYVISYTEYNIFYTTSLVEELHFCLISHIYLYQNRMFQDL